jgi:hypothetical protein
METNYEKGENLAYQELGKFLRNFEHTVYTFRENISHILKQDGLKQDVLSDIILERLTAEPIAKMFLAMLPYCYEKDEQEIFKSAIDKLQDLTELRNIIIHCYWIITPDLFDSEKVSMIGIKQRASKDGISNYNLDMEVVEMKKVNDIVEEFLEICCGIINKLKRNEKHFDQIKLNLKGINFKPYINHFKKSN